MSAHSEDNYRQDADQHLTIAETAAALHVSRWTIGRYIRAGELTAIKTADGNGSIRIPLSSYQAFLRRHTVRPHEEDQ